MEMDFFLSKAKVAPKSACRLATVVFRAQLEQINRIMSTMK